MTRLNTLIEESINEIKMFIKIFGNKLMLSSSGGLDSTVINKIIQTNNLDTNTIFFNKAVEPKENRKILNLSKKDYDRQIPVKTESYKSVVNRLGFPIGNKNFSDLCFRCAKPLKLKNAVDRFRVITGMPPKASYKKIYPSYNLPLEFWHLAKTTPIQTTCCRIFKKDPSKRIYKEEGMVSIVGIMASDSPERRTAIKKYEDTPLEERKHCYPLKNWYKSDVLKFRDLYLDDNEYSDIYKPCSLPDGRVVEGRTNSGCPACHYGSTKMLKCDDGSEISKFELMEIQYPKMYNTTMNMKHESGMTYSEALERFYESKEGKYLKESIILRDREIREVARLLEIKGREYIKGFLFSFIVGEKTFDETLAVLEWEIERKIQGI